MATRQIATLSYVGSSPAVSSIFCRLAYVVERYTRKIKDLAPATACRFDSCHTHQLLINIFMLNESVKIAPASSPLDPRIKKVLDAVFDTIAPKYAKNIVNAKYFNGGNVGVSFNIQGRPQPQWNLMYKPSRMGSNDLVRGTLVLQATGDYNPTELLRAPDSLNAVFPSPADLGKMAKTLTSIADVK